MPLTRVHCIIHGRVQGVAFRAATQRQAQHLGVHGWVRNRPDETVEVLAEGEQVSVQQLVDWCHRGPSGAYVTQMQVDWQPPTGELVGFEIRYFA